VADEEVEEKKKKRLESYVIINNTKYFAMNICVIVGSHHGGTLPSGPSTNSPINTNTDQATAGRSQTLWRFCKRSCQKNDADRIRHVNFRRPAKMSKAWSKVST